MVTHVNFFLERQRSLCGAGVGQARKRACNAPRNSSLSLTSPRCHQRRRCTFRSRGVHWAHASVRWTVHVGCQGFSAKRGLVSRQGSSEKSGLAM